MNLQFVRQAIYQQKSSGTATEQPVAAAERETWEPSVVIPSSDKPPEPLLAKGLPPPYLLGDCHGGGDLGADQIAPTSLLTTGGVEFRISPLLDSRESRLEERKALEEFHGLQSEARVVIVPETVVVTDRKASPPPKRARASVVVVKPNESSDIIAQAESSDKAKLLSAYGSDSED